MSAASLSGAGAFAHLIPAPGRSRRLKLSASSEGTLIFVQHRKAPDGYIFRLPAVYAMQNPVKSGS
jgi:hypothetical protein